MKKIVITMAAVILVMMAVTNSAKAVEYYITDLGTLGSDPQSKAFGVNDYGQVVGYSGMVQGPEEGRRAFLWDSANGMQNLGTLGGNHSEAYEINNTGQVVGRSTLPSGEGDVRGFLWEGSSMIDIGTLGGGWTEAHGINNSGQVVGYSVLSNSVEAFRWENNSMTTLQSLTGNSHGYAINEEGQIVGYVGSIAFMWEDGTVTSLGTLGGNYSFAWDISNSGWIVGESGVSGSPSHHAFLWIDGVMTGMGGGIAEAINDIGQVVGSFGLWENGTAVALNDLLQENPGWLDLYGRHINNSGQIVGEGLTTNGEVHAFLMTPVPKPPTIYYVDATEGSDDNDGLSKEAPFATIQKAIDSAFDGDTVLVADGTYTGDGNRDIDFHGKAITVRSESGPENCIIDCNGTEIDPHRGFYFHSSEDTISVLSGVTITGGYAIDGGGIYCEDSSPTISYCSIMGNSAGQFGGGMCNQNNSSPTVTNCTFSGNSAGYSGGGMCNGGGSPTVTNCTFSGNTAGYSGGGMYNGGSSPTVTNCTFSGNTAVYSGGGMYNGGSSPTVTNCDFSGNSADYSGGGMYNWWSSPPVTNCTFSGNSALNGNACACDSYELASNVEMTNCILWDGGQEIWNNDGSTITVNYTDLQGGQADCYDPYDAIEWGLGNIDEDPCFVDAGYWDNNDTPDDVNDDFWVDGDYYLLPDSLCIDAGDPNYIPEPDETDIDGNPRVINGRIDMGAYETNYIQAAMKLTPQMLNCNSRGNWVKAHFILPEGFLPEDVDVNESAIAEPMGAESEYIKVLGTGTGPVRLEIAFDREAFCETIIETGEVEVAVIGSLTTSRYFYATDTIKIKLRR